MTVTAFFAGNHVATDEAAEIWCETLNIMSDANLAEAWVFNGVGGQFPAGVLSDLGRAEAWIAKHRLSGTATLYHVDSGAYDWSVANGLFAPTKPQHSTPELIGRFAGGQEHHHYENGLRQG